MDGDTGWHIRTGEYILDRHSVPAADLFSFSKAGQPWFAWEWLSDVIYGFLFRGIGLKGVVLLSGLTISLTAAILLRYMLWRKANLFISLTVTLFCASAASIHFHARPHLFTLLLLVVSMWTLDRDRANHGRVVWLLIPLTTLWTNLHGGFLAMIALTGLLAGGSAVEAFLFERLKWADARRYSILWAGCSMATLLNPYGIGLHKHLLEYLKSDWIRDMVQEFHSPDFHSESMLYFEILLFLSVAAATAFVRRRHVVEALWLGYFAHMALASARHVTLFVLIAGPLVASELSRWWAEWSGGQPRKSMTGIVNQLAEDLSGGFQWASIWPLALALSLAAIGNPIHWPADFPASQFPIEIVSANQNRIQASRVLTSDQWGDYLIFRFYPKQKVFIDGRSDFYGKDIGKEYLAVLQGQYSWEKILNKYSFDLVLAPVSWPLCSLLKKKDEWRVLADDGKAILFQRETAFEKTVREANENNRYRRK